MFEFGSSIVLAIIEGATSALTSRFLTPKTESREPMDMRLIVREVARELRARDRALEISVTEMSQAVKGLRGMLERVPEFEVRKDDKVTYSPRLDTDLGDVMYRLDEEIAALRRSFKLAARSDSEPRVSQSVHPILEGLDEEIASLRTRSPHSEEDGLA